MVSALVFLAPGFEEIEAATVMDVLRRCGVSVTAAGLKSNAIEGAHGVKYVPDASVHDVAVKDFNAVICPGGSPGYLNLRKDNRVLNMVREAFLSNKLVAAICAAPAVLSDTGILRGKNCTIYPGMEAELIKGGGRPQKDLVVEDGNIITSQGPATALLFSLKVAERLVGKKTAALVRERTLTNLVVK